MARKKKKSNNRNDARGYSTGTVNLHKNKHLSQQQQTLEKVGKGTRTIQVTSEAYAELIILIDQLKQSMCNTSTCSDAEEGIKYDSDYSSKKISIQNSEHKSPIVNVSMENKRFVKKVTFLNDNLEQLGFTCDQIKKVLVALIFGEEIKSEISTNNTNHTHGDDYRGEDILSLEAALDWLCFHLQSNDLPKLFTDINLRQDDGNSINLSVIKAFQKEELGNESEDLEIVGEKEKGLRQKQNDSVCLKLDSTTKDNFLSKKDGNIETSRRSKADDEDDGKEAAKRAWLLSHYQYEDEHSIEDLVHDQVKIEQDKVDVGTKTEERAKFPEEIRLERLEGEIQDLTESLNDEANNYMRSKYEIAEMKKTLKKLTGQAKGLRGKVAKKITSLEVIQDREEEKQEEECCAMELFGNNPLESVAGISTVTMEKYIEVNIPSDWSGKTPKVILLEHCRKQKWPKPTFTKIENTNNGCVVKVKQFQNDVKIMAEEGPFRSIVHAEHYVSTKILYALNPNLPMHLLMPPDFRDLWTSWLKEKEMKRNEVLMIHKNERSEKIASLVAHLLRIVTESENNGSNRGPRFSESFENSSKDTPDNWDEESSDSNANNVVAEVIAMPKISTSVPNKLGKALQDSFARKQKSKSYEKMYRNRQCLPIFDYRQQILETVRDNSVTVLCAETGAGKTTQCPQYILEEGLMSGFGDRTNIICTQPRRISALSVAERVAEEMDDTVGRQVGYHIRMEAKKTKQTKLLFCTTGVVLRRLQDDPNLDGVTHVIVDEVHERQWEIDFLLIALRRLLNTTRKVDLKVILMSATLDSKLFCSFFQNAPFLSVPGRTFPVAEYYLEDLFDATDHLIDEDSKYAIWEDRDYEKASIFVTGRGGEKRKELISLDSEIELSEVSGEYKDYKMSTRRSMERVNEEIINYDLIEDLLLFLLNTDKNDKILPPDSEEGSLSGSILIFLPGIGEIRSLHDRLRANIHFSNPKRFDIIPMHSTLSPKEQKRAFLKPKNGCQKIIIATNIAETSITIDDCVCVIDSGICREVMQDKNSSTSKLVTTWCSKASSKQRAGRAGRVQPGICCRLYSSKTASKMKKQSTPELQRIPLEEVCLKILAANLATNCMDFLMNAPQPPSNENVTRALKVLEEVDAIEPVKSQIYERRAEVITPLGKHLAKLPVEIRLGKMLIFGVLFKVLDKTLTIAASLSSKSPFSTNIDEPQRAEAAHRAFIHPTSDFLTICNVWEAYTTANTSAVDAKRFCQRNYLNKSAFIEISDTRKQFIILLSQIGFIDAALTESGVLGSPYNINGSNENVLGAVLCAGLYPNCAHVLTKQGESLPSIWQEQKQLWFHKSSALHNKKKIEFEWVIYHEKFATHKVYVSTTSPIKPFSLLLFGKSIQVKHLDRKVVVDGWIELKIPAQTGVIFRELRKEMSKVLESYISNVKEREDNIFIAGIIKLLKLE